MAKKCDLSKCVESLRKFALSLPETEEGTSCDKAAFKARGKAFFFMGVKNGSLAAMLKLSDSLPEATKLAAQDPDHYKAGGTGWVTLTFNDGALPPAGLLEKWIDESFRLLAPKQLVAMLPATKKR